jgi:hypothetical protein
VTRLATAGASVPEIAGVTGHSLMDVLSILDGHYLGQKLEKSERRTKVSNRSKTNLQDKIRVGQGDRALVRINSGRAGRAWLPGTASRAPRQSRKLMLLPYRARKAERHEQDRY